MDVLLEMIQQSKDLGIVYLQQYSMVCSEKLVIVPLKVL